MSNCLDLALENVKHYRDRFSAWGTLVGIVAFVAGMWMVAPTLEVSVPLVGTATATINLGYVLMGGMPLLAILQAWLLGALASMRRNQEAVLDEVGQGAELSSSQRLNFLGPLSSTPNSDNRAFNLALWVRIFVFFILPVFAELWIGVEYFSRLCVYEKETVVNCIKVEKLEDLMTNSPSEWRLKNKRRVTAREYLWKNKFNGETTFAIPNSDLERDCMQIWVLEKLRDAELQNKDKMPEGIVKSQKAILGNLEKRTKGINCILSSFPRYVMPLNSWINIASFLFSIWLAVVGWRIYIGIDVKKRLASKQNVRIEYCKNTLFKPSIVNISISLISKFLVLVFLFDFIWIFTKLGYALGSFPPALFYFFLPYAFSSGIFLIVYKITLKSKLYFAECFIQELTRTFIALLFLCRIEESKTKSANGIITNSDKTNWFIILSPYSLPILTYSLMGALLLIPEQIRPIAIHLVAMSYVWYVISILKCLKQPNCDVSLTGRFFARTFIVFANMVNTAIIFCYFLGNKYLLLLSLDSIVKMVFRI